MPSARRAQLAAQLAGTMIARILRALLVLQLLAVAGLWLLAVRFWHVAPGPALLLALGLLILVRALITANNFFLNWRYRSATPVQHRSRPGAWWRMFFEEFGATLLASSWSMAWPGAARCIWPDGVGPPVLLIHGYGCNCGYWRQLSALLRQAHISHDAIDLEPIGAAIDDYVPQVQRAVLALCAASGSERVIIVAHSMGGLVARACLRVHGGKHVARVIMLGTPHHGTRLASFGFGRNARQMRRGGRAPDAGGSAWLAALAATEDAQRRAGFTSIYSHHDNIVAPQTSCHLPGAKNIELGGIGHVALGCNRHVLRCVLDEIAGQACRVRPVASN